LEIVWFKQPISPGAQLPIPRFTLRRQTLERSTSKS
jgi:hypothetical protein